MAKEKVQPHCYIDTAWFKTIQVIVCIACPTITYLVKRHDERKVIREEIEKVLPKKDTSFDAIRRVRDLMAAQQAMNQTGTPFGGVPKK